MMTERTLKTTSTTILWLEPETLLLLLVVGLVLLLVFELLVVVLPVYEGGLTIIVELMSLIGYPTSSVPALWAFLI